MRVNCTINGAPAVADDVWEGESLLFVLGAARPAGIEERLRAGRVRVVHGLDGVVVCLPGRGRPGAGGTVCTVGIAPSGALDSVQQAFLDAGAVQCRFCTPGLIVAADDLLRRVPRPADPRSGSAGKQPVPLHRIEDPRRRAAGAARRSAMT
jgi:carbon-monoxide dehydrogenase small subunit